MEASDWIALAALAVAVFTYWNQRKTNQAMLDYQRKQEKQEEVQSHRAVLFGSFIHDSGPGYADFRLRVDNVGQCEAREVRVTLDGCAIQEHRFGVPSLYTTDTVAARSYLLYRLSGPVGRPYPCQVEIRWTDDSGERGCWKQALSW